MLDALTDRTRVTTAGLLRAKQHDAGVGHERHSAAEPFPLWSNASYVIHILPLKTEVKHRVPCSPARDCPFELEITFCVRGVISPLLANVYLDELDRELERRKHRFVRYADDCNIYVASERAGKRVTQSVTGFLRRRLKLKVNEAKSAVARPQERKFLGFSFTGGGEPQRPPPPKTPLRSARKGRGTTRRTRGHSP